MCKRASRGANVLLTQCSNCKKNENILFVTDPTGCEVAMAMWSASIDFPNRTLIMMNEREMHGENPNMIVAKAMSSADVIFACTKYSLFHSDARKDAVKRGARFVNMADYDLAMMESGGIFCDYEKERVRCAAVAEMLRGGNILKITTDLGTHLTCSITGREPKDQYGVSLEPGDSSSPPDIECATCAVEGTAEGVVYIDASIPHPELGLITEPIKLVIKKGLVESVSGGKQAEILNKVLKECNDNAVYNVGEIGIGINSSGILNGRMLSDEGCGGTVHLGLGDNRGFGGIVSSPYHLDLIFHKPTITVDGKVVINNGEIVM